MGPRLFDTNDMTIRILNRAEGLRFVPMVCN